MAERVIRGFDFLVSLAGKFVDSQKGVWDRKEWLNFLSDVQKLGFELSNDMMNDLNSVVESMKKLYKDSTSTESIRLYTDDVYEQAVIFLMNTKGIYDQSEWETFLNDLQKEGVDLTDEIMSYLEEIFEAAKNINFTLLPIIKKAEIKEMLKKEVKETKKTNYN